MGFVFCGCWLVATRFGRPHLRAICPPLASYLLSGAFKSVSYLLATCFSLARHLLSACLEGKAHRPQTRPGGRLLPAAYPAPSTPLHIIDDLAFMQCAPYTARTDCPRQRAAPCEQNDKPKAPPKTRQTAAGSGGGVELGGELPARHDRPRRDEFLPRHDSWRSVPMTARPPAASTFSCSSARLPFDVAGSSSTPLPLNEEGFWFGTVGLCHPDELASVFWTTFQLSRALRRGTIPKSNG